MITLILSIGEMLMVILKESIEGHDISADGHVLFKRKCIGFESSVCLMRVLYSLAL